MYKNLDGGDTNKCTCKNDVHKIFVALIAVVFDTWHLYVCTYSECTLLCDPYIWIERLGLYFYSHCYRARFSTILCLMWMFPQMYRVGVKCYHSYLHSLCRGVNNYKKCETMKNQITIVQAWYCTSRWTVSILAQSEK